MKCPNCNSEKIAKTGFKPTLKEGRKQRYQCQQCGKTFFTPKGENEK
jgi:transposase-like protein